ncbi:MAG: hypothetical protein IKW91_10965 [Bacteroidaceae bacterium]|nr:hypothetical protein [Bacteroidaceae bacterium]
MEELKQLLSQLDANSSADDIKTVFSKIAEILKNTCIIKYNNNEYRILDFEFYFYNQHHQDISVHPRKSEALCWYINEFGGIDLNFKSRIDKKEIIEKNGKLSFKYKMTYDSYYGGILIRQIQRQSDKVVFDGPWKVAELFRILDATSQSQDTPLLSIITRPLEKIEFENKKRHNLLGSKKDITAKVDYNVKEWFTGDSVLDKNHLRGELDELSKSILYRYCWKEKTSERTI